LRNCTGLVLSSWCRVTFSLLQLPQRGSAEFGREKRPQRFLWVSALTLSTRILLLPAAHRCLLCLMRTAQPAPDQQRADELPFGDGRQRHQHRLPPARATSGASLFRFRSEPPLLLLLALRGAHSRWRALVLRARRTRPERRFRACCPCALRSAPTAGPCNVRASLRCSLARSLVLSSRSSLWCSLQTSSARSRCRHQVCRSCKIAVLAIAFNCARAHRARRSCFSCFVFGWRCGMCCSVLLVDVCKHSGV
jgi:hypothetical protein